MGCRQPRRCDVHQGELNCFVDSTLAGLSFAIAAVESAVWAHARGEEWDWPYAIPGRVEDKYELWGDQHPLTYDI